MIVLGISGAVSHDPSAALFIDGELVAAAEEERFIREKHAKGKYPYEATRFCLDYAGIDAADVDVVTFPYAQIPLSSPARWHYAARHWYAPDRALDAIFNGNRRYRRNLGKLQKLIDDLGIGAGEARIMPVEHHLAHASSAYHLGGFSEKTAILGIDGKGEYATTFFGYGENGRIHKIKEFYDPDSLGGLYGALTEYLGFEMLDGEFKVMGMAPYGDPNRFDFSRLIEYDKQSFKINNHLVNVIGTRRYKDADGKGYYFSQQLIDWLGPKREGDEIDDPYIDYAASIQQLLEDVSLGLIDHYLGDILRETGRICFAGGVALNVKLNQRIIARPDVKELFVQPAASDAGTALGAASYVANELGDSVRPMAHAYLGTELHHRAVHRGLQGARKAAGLGACRGRAGTRGADPGRRQSPGLVPGAHGIRSARTGQSLDTGFTESPGHRRADQRADQVPRALASLLSEHAGSGRPRDVADRPSGALHDLYL